MNSSTSVFDRSYGWFRGFVQGKTRITLAWIFVVIVAVTTRDRLCVPGLMLSFLGASIRFWASGYLRKDTRPAVGGPYVCSRNPLYLGTYLMAIGVGWAIENLPLTLGCSILYALIYHYIILDEEVKLRKIFGASYEHYCGVVPRFFPNFYSLFSKKVRKELHRVNPVDSHHHFSWTLARKNKAQEAYLTFAGLCLVLQGMVFIRGYLQ